MRRRALLSGGSIDYSNCFAMVVTTGGNITWTGSTTDNTLSYSKDNGRSWTTASSATIPVSSGDKVLWKGTPTPQEESGIGTFSGDTNVRYSVEGNVMSLLFGDNFKNQTSLSGKKYALYDLFNGNTNVTSAENLKLPATTLASGCYYAMFSGCTSLTTAPELPATKLTTQCYSDMFNGCTSLTTAPQIYATELATSCCYKMFQNCTSLTKAPVLLAKTLGVSSYRYMFYGCTSLNSITCLATNISASNCTNNWVTNVAASGTFTKAESMSGWSTGNSGIPEGWIVRNYLEPVVLYPEDYDTPIRGYITSGGKWAKATSSGKQTWVFHDVTEFQGGTCNLYLGSVTGYYAFVKEIPTAAGSVQYASGWSNRATLSQDIADIPIPSDAVYLCFYYHGSTGNMYPSKVEIYPQE